MQCSERLRKKNSAYFRRQNRACFLCLRYRPQPCALSDSKLHSGDPHWASNASRPERPFTGGGLVMQAAGQNGIRNRSNQLGFRHLCRLPELCTARSRMRRKAEKSCAPKQRDTITVCEDSAASRNKKSQANRDVTALGRSHDASRVVLAWPAKMQCTPRAKCGNGF